MDEHPPTQEPQVCKKCRALLPATWFHLMPQKSTGRHGSCLACCAKQHRALSRRVPHTPQQKECQQCRRTLKAACFHRKRASADGLRRVCRDCLRGDKQTRKRPLVSVQVPDKRCGVCKLVKPAAGFYAWQSSSDGLCTECKECTNLRRRRQRQQSGRQDSSSSSSSSSEH